MYEFLVNKLLVVFIASNAWLGTELNLPRFDLIIMNNGDEVKCKVMTVNGPIVDAATKNGEIRIVREMNVNAARDIIETGIIRNKRYSGKVIYLGSDFLDIETYSGKIRVNAGLVRKIIIAQEPSLNL
jgi:hypothetical protein